MGVQGALRPVLCILALCAVAGIAGLAAAEPATHPRWDRCRGKWPPDPPGLGKRIALTFDDGPSVKLTPKVLAILRKHKVPAAFFMVGERVRGRAARALVADIAGDPLFVIGNHSQTHPKLNEMTIEAATVEIDRAGRAIESAAGAAPRWFRFPYSLSTCATADLVRKRGYRIAGWHVDSADWCYAAGAGRCAPEMWADVPDALRGDMLGLVRRRLRDNDGGIVLLHDIHWRTVDRLDELIRLLRGDGYTFVRIDDATAFPLLNQP
jgi:peptidoglycan/xylan/chitin deacetylase (PgdA/CDA1 family)